MSTIHTVSELSEDIRHCLADHFPYVYLKGEVTNLKMPQSGHTYFALRDSESVMQALCWRWSNIGITPKEGDSLVCFGKLSVYRSCYQVTVIRARYDGLGHASERLQVLTKKLEKEGLFEQSLKKPVPRIPTCIGIVTSMSGAVVQDVFRTVTRRFPCRVLVRNTKVQGIEAAANIVRSLQHLNVLALQKRLSVILLVRGGGSAEELEVFNKEEVVRAIVASTIPVVTGIGHAIDTTLADEAADLQTPTPTAAAEAVTPNKADILQLFSRVAAQLRQTMELKIRGQYTALQVHRKKLKWCFYAIHRLHAQTQLQMQRRLLKERFHRYSLIEKVRQRQRCQTLLLRLTHAHALQKRSLRRSYAGLLYTLHQRMQQRSFHVFKDVTHTTFEKFYYDRCLQLEKYRKTLEQHDQQAVLRQGYAVVSQVGRATRLREGATVQKGDLLTVALQDATLTVQVVECHRVEQQRERGRCGRREKNR